MKLLLIGEDDGTRVLENKLQQCLDASGEITTISLDNLGDKLRAEKFDLVLMDNKQAEEMVVKYTEDQALLLDNIETQVWYLKDEQTYGAVNKAHAEFMGAEKEELAHKNLYDFMDADEVGGCIEGNKEVFEAKRQTHTEEWIKNCRGETRLLAITKTPKLNSHGKVEYVVCSAEDITDQRQMEDALRKREEERTKELNLLYSFFLLLRQEGYDLEKTLAETAKLLPPSFQHPQLACACITLMERQYKTKGYQNTPWKISSTLKAQNQQIGTIEVCYLEHPDQDREPFLKEEKIMLDMVTEELGQVIERNWLEREHKRIFELSMDMIGYADIDGKIIEVNPACEKILGWKQEEFIGSSFFDYIHPEDQDATYKATEKLADGEPVEGFTNRYRCKDGSYRWLSWNSYPELDLHRAFFVARDITYAMKAKEELRNAHDRLEVKVEERTADLKRAVKQVQALRNIDMAITSSLDLRVIFKAILDEVTSLLNVDGAAIMRVDPNTATLHYKAWRGFTVANPRDFSMSWGEEFAGRVAMNREVVHIPDLKEKEQNVVQRPLMEQEGFISYYAVPLIAKGYVQGVLEVFHTQSLNEGDEWLNFLETLAGQASVAIDSAELFNKLERSHVELLQAYDATIEGWAYALDLKDKETEEHSQRVTEMTVSIARKMNIKNEELPHIRRGALLHDIGKMGVPDSILLKPGKLDEGEWEIMKKHPVYAYEMLAPIDYLRPALDIPYCHHEKWDGSGYPRGLKGKQIPLAARIFAVVDVYDSLTSDKPYRKAWSEEDTLALIKKESGSHFDPEVVKVFLEYIQKKF